MKLPVWIIGLFAAAIALTAALRNPAYVMLVYPPYRVELSLTLFVILALSAFVLGYGLVRLTLGAMQLPSYVRQFRLERAQARSREILDKVLGAFFEGRYAAAARAAAQAMESGETSALHPIIAARSAHELRDFKKRDAYLSVAQGTKNFYPGTRETIGDATMRLMTTSKFMLDQRDSHAALEALQELRDSGVKGHPGAMWLELKAQQQAGNWDEVLSLLDQLENLAAIDALTAEQMRQQAWLKKINQQESMAGLTACLKAIPADIKRRGKFIVAAAHALIRHGGCSLAQQLLTDSLNSEWDGDVVALYGECQSDDVIAQIEQAEKWLNHHKQDTGLLLALGKLCLHQKLWGKARGYLDASISLKPSAAAYNALGDLAKQLGNSDEALKYYQSAVAMAGSVKG